MPLDAPDSGDLKNPNRTARRMPRLLTERLLKLMERLLKRRASKERSLRKASFRMVSLSNHPPRT